MNNESMSPIRVLVVDDSSLSSKMIVSLISSDPFLNVVGIASNGREAVELVSKLKPDLITMDLKMPVMDGFEATKQIMAFNPTPILILSSSVFKDGMNLAFKALSYGALDVMDKSRIEVSTDFIERIKILARVKVIHHPMGKLEEMGIPKKHKTPKDLEGGKIVAIAASTGGPQALQVLLRLLPEDFPCGIVIVQHIAEGFAEGLAAWLDDDCQMRVKVAREGEHIEPGVVYFAPTGFHTRVEIGGIIHLVNETTEYANHKPSGNILFESVAKVYGDQAIAVILTGMGKDGADGLKRVKEAHGKIFAQDEASSIIFGMPKAAIDLGIVDEVLPLNRIAETILREVRYQGKM
ncbi:MAG: chemotaxis response regulator protein-glutamate methylesterase [Chlamydiae bacterium]|nr:chemotaxis response regulator protein-glutamate methylesterase [Chlamydiota bacterium]MBI3276706.1 chemotaxis response regulator protein-glutamate methylesterase [Chlamydiota bacterium]